MTSKINTLFILSFLLLNLNSCKTLQIEKQTNRIYPQILLLQFLKFLCWWKLM
jgi:hypothetical protein